MFIVFEGIDGSGKTTQAELLKKSLEKQGFSVILTKEPTKFSSVSQKIRKILNKEIIVTPKELQELFIEDRREHLEKLVIPSLKEGKIVISDRYYLSTIAYGKPEKISITWLIEKNRDFLEPDIIFIFDIDPEISLKRIQNTRNTSNLFEKIEKLRLVREEYKKLSKYSAKLKISSPKANQYFNNLIYIDEEQSIEKIHLEILSFVVEKLQKTNKIDIS